MFVHCLSHSTLQQGCYWNIILCIYPCSTFRYITCYDVPHGYSIPTLILDTNFGFALNFFPFRTVLDLTQLKLRYMFVDLKLEIAEFWCYSYPSPHMSFVATFDLYALHIALHSYWRNESDFSRNLLSLWRACVWTSSCFKWSQHEENP